MSVTVVVLILLFLIIAVAAVLGVIEHGKRGLRAPLGAEYDRLVEEHGSRQAADQELARRRHTHDQLQIRPISPEDRRRFAEEWEHVQAGFLDAPDVALDGAERLVAEVLDARGYPANDPGERMALASVEHGRVMTDFREAETLAARVRSGQNGVSTEAMRVAVRQYRAVFFDLIGETEPEQTVERSAPRAEIEH